MSDTSVIELSPAPTATDEPYVSLTVLSDMRLLMSPTQIAREGEHNSALFKVVAQPSSLDAYACRAEVRTSDGALTYRLVADGEFRLTIDMAVTGIGHLQLVYSDGVDVTRKTALAQFTVARSINAVDQSDPDFQDGLAYLQSRAFANVTYAADSGVLAFYNVGMNPLASVIVAGGTGGGLDEAAADLLYLRRDGAGGMNASISISGANRGVLFDADGIAPAIYSDPTGLRLRRPAGNAEVTIEDNSGTPASRSPVITEASGDARYQPLGGGIEDVPAANGAYARFRGATGAEWMDFTTLRVAPLDSPLFAGVPTAPTPDAGDASTRLATTQFVARDFLPRAGGQMTGPLITIPGTGATSPGLAIGDNSTGFYRPAGGLLNCTVGGVGITQFMPAVAAFFVPLNVGNNVIQAVGDPGQPTDGLNLRTGDSRYLQQTVADSRYLPQVGGSLSGDLYMTAASGIDGEIGVALGGRGGRVYWSSAVVLRRGGAGESVYVENNNGSNRSEVITQLLGDARYVGLAAGGIVAGPLQVLQSPFLPADATNKGYVDAAVGGITASTALRSQVYAPAAFAIPVPSTVPQQFFDGNFTLPAVGIRQILVTVDPLFSSAGSQGSMWGLIYTLAANSVVSAAVVPMIAYKFTTDDDGMLRATAKFLAAIDATSGVVRVQLYVHCPTSQGGGGALTQVGNVQPTGPQTLITVQDLGPAI